MPEYKYPGVYIEEIGTGPRPIEGVPTSTAAFLGETERGPLTPQLVTSYTDYQHWFGGVFDAKKYMPHAINGFFENGGKRAFVCRVVGDGYAEALAAIAAPAFRAISLVYAPSASVDVAKAVVAHCEEMRYRFAIIGVWGARTLASDVEWKYINVRRLFIFLERSIDEGTQWTVFEPNDERLWGRVADTIRQFLRAQWRDGALQGQTEQDAFFIRCDRTTMTQDDILNGRLICEVGVAPVKPAEFVIFRIAKTTSEADLLR